MIQIVSLSFHFQINAVATLCGIVIPAFFPRCHKFTEVGSYHIASVTQEKFMLVSPDGIIKCTENCDQPCESKMNFPIGPIVVEIKSPFSPIGNAKMLPVQYHPPHYNVCQILSQQFAAKSPMALFVSCSPQSTVVSLVDFKIELWNKIFDLATELYADEQITKATALHGSVQELKQDLKLQSVDAEVVVEIPTIIGTDTNTNINSYTNDNLYRKPPTLPHEAITDGDVEFINRDIIELCGRASDLIKSAHQLQRRKASEVLMFVATDCDREFQKDSPTVIPIAYGLKGRSIRIATGRKIINQVREKLHQNGINVLCEAVDGQWAGIVFRDENGQPLTMFELQRDSWLKFAKMSKDSIINYIHTACYVNIEEKQYCSELNIDYFAKHTFGNIEFEILAKRSLDGEVRRELHFNSLAGEYNRAGVLNFLFTLRKSTHQELWEDGLLMSHTLLDVLGINADASNTLHQGEST